jgi:hypothetical protein
MRPEAEKGGALRTAAIFFVAGACGWLIMELEILGARILAPYFGSDIYVTWGSVIGVFLLSLSGGYLLGGWVSRRPASKSILAFSIMAAGGWLLVLPSLVQPLSDGLLDAGLSDRLGSLIAALALFAVPTVLLATVSPTVVRWLTSRARDSGLNAGLVFAFSTVASFAGCLTTAFYLVRLSMRRTVRASGVVLIALGAAVLIHRLVAGRPREEGGTP